MNVHIDQAGDQIATRCIDDLDADRQIHFLGIPRGHDPFAGDDHGLVRPR